MAQHKGREKYKKLIIVKRMQKPVMYLILQILYIINSASHTSVTLWDGWGVLWNATFCGVK